MKALLAALCLLAVSAVQAAGLAGISNADAGLGIREALAVGADYAVSTLGRENGFLGNDKVRIPLPASLHKAEKALRAVGLGKHADELVTTINRAAEKAVAEAKPVLVDAVRNMTWQDAKGILTGGEDSVTQFFRRTSSERLAEKFLPIVQGATRQLKLADRYNKFAGKAATLGLIDKKDASLDRYVTDKAMEGLFLMIAEKEKSIRQNPAAAATAMLKKVFGAL